MTAADKHIDELLESVLEKEETYSVGDRIQIYRKGWAATGKAPTIAINCTIRSVDNNGWLNVQHRWGMAIVKPGEKVNKIQGFKDVLADTEVKSLVKLEL